MYIFFRLVLKAKYNTEIINSILLKICQKMITLALRWVFSLFCSYFVIFIPIAYWVALTGLAIAFQGIDNVKNSGITRIFTSYICCPCSYDSSIICISSLPYPSDSSDEEEDEDYGASTNSSLESNFYDSEMWCILRSSFAFWKIGITAYSLVRTGLWRRYVAIFQMIIFWVFRLCCWSSFWAHSQFRFHPSFEANRWDFIVALRFYWVFSV